MKITPHVVEDRDRLVEHVGREADARQRDRYRAVLLAMDGHEGDAVARTLARSPRFVDEWVGRYRRGGMAALVPLKQPGRRPSLTPDQERRLRERQDAGATDADGVCTLRGRDVCRIIEAEFGVVHTLGGIYDVLRRLGQPRVRRLRRPAAADRPRLAQPQPRYHQKHLCLPVDRTRESSLIRIRR